MTPQQNAGIERVSLRQAAVVAGIGLLIVGIAAPFSQFYAFPALSEPAGVAALMNGEEGAHRRLLAGIFAYIVNYTFDIIVAWALYILLAPVNRALSQLALLFCLVYLAMAMAALLNYVEAFRLLHSPALRAALGDARIESQLHLLLNSYQFDWGFSLLVFGAVLLLRGYLVIRSAYIPSVLGWLLTIAGVGYIAYELGLYLSPETDLSFLIITFLAEPIFMIWLLIRGWRIEA